MKGVAVIKYAMRKEISHAMTHVAMVLVPVRSSFLGKSSSELVKSSIIFMI